MLSSSKGAGFQAQGVDPAQLKTAYNQTQSSIKQQQDFVNALSGQNGLANQSNVFGQQQGLADQFQNIASGVGPNPAQAMLAQATGQNVSNQAALMAGQRGAGANTGLLARQAAQQGAGIQQQAAGQGATMQAQQSLAALGQLQNQQANMANMANTQVGQQQAGLQQLANQGLQQQSNLMGLQSNINSANAGIAAQNAQSQANLLGNVMGGAGDAIMFAAEGGKVEDKLQSTGPRSVLGKLHQGIPMAEGGKVPALVSPGEVYLKPQDVQQVAKGQKAPLDGEKIPGKPKVKGAKNSYANDTVPKTLEEGGIILPRSVTQAKNAPDKAAEFVRAILAKQNKSLPKR
jgi:hypothetical protein